jgi:hypothetical protein
LGARQRRVTGDQYDFFSIDYELEDGVHVQSMCRQIDGCANNVSEFIVGSNGSVYLDQRGNGTIYGPGGEIVWNVGPADAENLNSPYVQEHVDLVTAIRTEKPINEAVNTAESTLTAVMGRISAYTGQAMTWDEMMASDLRLGPAEYAVGPVDYEAKVPAPGIAEGA